MWQSYHRLIPYNHHRTTGKINTLNMERMHTRPVRLDRPYSIMSSVDEEIGPETKWTGLEG